MDKNINEIERLKNNINVVRQIRFSYESKVAQFGMSPDYFRVVMQEISTKKVQFISFVLEMPDSWAYDYNDEVRKLYTELKNKYKETAEFFGELHKMANDKLEEAKIKQFNIASTTTKSEVIENSLTEYGFFDLETVKILSKANQCILITKISISLPYAIAMFEHLGFIKYLSQQHFGSKTELNKEIAKWFSSDKDGRAVKGNINVLSNNSKEDRSRFTAHLHKEKVKKDYEDLI